MECENFLPHLILDPIFTLLIFEVSEANVSVITKTNILNLIFCFILSM